MYKIVRLYQRPIVNTYRGGGGYTRRTIKSGLTLEQAQAHCSDPETSSSTATSAKARKRTRERGPWFDSYQET